MFIHLYYLSSVTLFPNQMSSSCFADQLAFLPWQFTFNIAEEHQCGKKNGTAHNIPDRLTIERVDDGKNEKVEENHPNFSEFVTAIIL